MARYAALAACLLGLAAGVLAQPLSCTPGHLQLEMVAPHQSVDPIGKCLTSVKLVLNDDCSVQLISKSSYGSHLPAVWSADPSYDIPNISDCPNSRPPVEAVQGTGTKLEAVRNAAIKAFASYVYGLDENAQYIYEIEVPDLDFFPGKLVVKRLRARNLVYVITEADVSPDDMLCDDDITPLGEIPDCPALAANDPVYSAEALCLSNADSHTKCPDNAYGVMVVADEYKNSWDENYRAFKVCAWCPPGTSGSGFGCTACPAGTISVLGGDCEPCPEGTYSNGGSSVCIPCPMGKYSNTAGAAECIECPEDTYTWIPGAKACLRCIRGIPEECPDGDCPSGIPTPQVAKSMPATMIAKVTAMGANDGKCNLDATNPTYEIKSWTKCKGWSSTMQLAFTVYGDCSIQISPITDPSCAEPTSTVGHQYGAIQQRAYYYSDGAGNFKIRSLFDTTSGVKSDTILAIEYLNGDKLAAKWYPVTFDANEAWTNALIRDMPPVALVPEVCKATITVTGGLVLGAGNLGLPIVPSTWSCPPGSFYHEYEVCPFCPVGYRCPGGLPKDAGRIPCADDYYNAINGLAGACTKCPGSGPGTYTNYAAAEQCDVERLDLACDGDTTRSYAFDNASKECKLCPAGTYRDYTGSTECIPCDAGYYSAEGDAKCTECPAGEYSPSQGLADQFDITGFHCVKCAEGSMPLTEDNVDPATGGAGLNAIAGIASTFCDACPAGTWLDNDAEPCQACPQDTYRAGDATPENNVCKPIPEGYKLADSTHHTLALCEPGTVSFYDNGDKDSGKRIPENDETSCISCADIDNALGTTKYAHTHAPRKGMTACIPCPGGTIPDSTGGRTAGCSACPNGQYRSSNTISATCTPCGAGFEVGPNNKMDCTQCRPGQYMTAARATSGGVAANTCELCPRHYYRPTFGAISCLPCPRGTMTTNTGNVECTACPIGYFNNGMGQACQAAPPGTFVNTTGAFQSTPCPKGTWSKDVAQDNCNPCAPGRYSNTFGSTECKTCPAGTYSPGQATTCIPCRPGYYSPAGSAACAPCKPGTYAPDAQTTQCKPCPKGYQCPTNAMRKEGPCPRGTFSPREGLRQCTPCPINTFSLGGGTSASPYTVMACVKCQPGTNTRGLVGQSKCQVIRPQVRRMGL